MKKKKDEELTPWAKYQRDHKNQGRSSKGSSKKTPRSKRRASVKSGVSFKINKKKSVVFGAVLVLMLLIGVYFFSPISQVRSIKISGNKRTSTSEISKNLTLKKGDSIFASMFKKGSYENQLLKKDSDLKNVTIDVSLAGRANVQISENAIMGYVIRNKMYYTVRQDGTVVKKDSKQPTGNYPIFRGFKNDGTLKKFLKEYAQMPNEVQNGVAEVTLSPTKNIKNRIHFFMNDGNQVYAVINSFAKKMKYYPEISASMKKKGIIDLQVGAYSRPYGWTDEYKESRQSSEAESSYAEQQKAATKKSANMSSSETNSSTNDSDSVE
ncbi:cell division protein FtsQ/DivIB [Pediococcus stilesii]|uniref:Cell division protein DivIB n=1 Tax=Pediococcus stilesii TaxID=331679 RepID=A0A0R2KXH6_9LACO|nr:cell division protein FtsQ/DivIB [Pediococcus stilesii]KRN94016.1 cell division protein FtsQ [Pediococcus stilesii]